MNGIGKGEGTGVLEGAVIAVAGAAGPAGRATLLRLAEAGATVVGCDANPKGLAEAVDACRTYAYGLLLDLLREERDDLVQGVRDGEHGV
ncbi:hypothetical protein ABZ136_29760, partial [Streptomyces microflavus]